MVESPYLNILAIIAITLLVVVTGGVMYLTLADWRDRRRQQDEAREIRRGGAKPYTPTKKK
jgi:hypothetical protein